MTSAPHSASPIAAAWPIPLVPPVTKAVCPSSENIAVPVAILSSLAQLKLRDLPNFELGICRASKERSCPTAGRHHGGNSLFELPQRWGNRLQPRQTSGIPRSHRQRPSDAVSQFTWGGTFGERSVLYKTYNFQEHHLCGPISDFETEWPLRLETLVRGRARRLLLRFSMV